MYEQVKPIAGVLLNMEEDLKREFETRIAETSTLAFRVAFAVLRNSENAEDVAAGSVCEGVSLVRAASRSGSFPRLAREDDLANGDQSDTLGTAAFGA